MTYKTLIVKRSQLPGAGKGLYTTKDIATGTLVIQYKGASTTWKAIKESNNFNGYVYYVNRNHVIDAKPYKQHIARYANDARGLSKLEGVHNNCCYTIVGKSVFIKALRNIKAGEELFVGYGKEYWDVIKYNQKIRKKSTNKK